MMCKMTLCLDPLNAGQFFACCGVIDLLAMGDPELRVWFETNEETPRSADCVVEGADDNALRALLAELRTAPYRAVKHAEKTIQPVEVDFARGRIRLDWWLDDFSETTTNLKCWAGQVTSIRLFEELAPLVDETCAAADLFRYARATKSKFGVDPRSAWNGLDYGFSPDQHNQDAATYPHVELLAAVGLQGFRPDAAKRTIRYCLWSAPLTLNVARLAAFAPWDGLAHSEYSFEVAKRGQSYKYFTFSELKGRKIYFI